MLEVLKFIKNNEDWKLKLESKPYCISIKEDEDYFLLKYNMIESDFSQPIVKECRGLILRKSDLKPLALSFKKFHNYQETQFADEIDWKSARIQEKIDGSKILVWFDKIWHVSTSGSIDAYTAYIGDTGLTFGSLFDEALLNYFELPGVFFNMLDPKKCYTFELISPKNRIVIDYPKTDIYFIGLRNIETFEELKPITESILDQIKKPKEYLLNSFEACIEAANRLGSDKEGFVVVDDNWHRVKIKSPLYVTAHYARNNGVQTNERLLEVIENETIDDFLSFCPEWEDIIVKLKKAKGNILQYMYNSCEEILNNKDLKSQKDFALLIMQNYKSIQSFLFWVLKVIKNKKENINSYWLVDNYWAGLTLTKKLEFIKIEMNQD